MAVEENCTNAGEVPGLRSGRRKGQVGGLFIPSFNAPPSVPFSPPSQTHFPFLFFFSPFHSLFSILSSVPAQR